MPVYGLGQYKDGRPYYAMRFIQGSSLKEATDRFHNSNGLDASNTSLQLRQLLGRFIDVCQAIEYAHSRGVVHRDLKPANIMLGKYGETLVVDWGLAKVIGREGSESKSDERTLTPVSGGDSEATEMGSVVGTPAYMSPEQAGGRVDELGCRSDVYSLGATLYYILLGQTPFSGKDIGAMLRMVEAGEFPHPRSLDAGIPKPLEAVCVKAMAKGPEDRYERPQALAEDIERFLADEPVTAMQEPLSLRAKRWVRKHPTLVTAISATVMIGLVSALSIAGIVSGKNKQLAKVNTALDTLNVDLTASNDQLDKINQAFDEQNRNLTLLNNDLI